MTWPCFTKWIMNIYYIWQHILISYAYTNYEYTHVCTYKGILSGAPYHIVILVFLSWHKYNILLIFAMFHFWYLVFDIHYEWIVDGFRTFPPRQVLLDISPMIFPPGHSPHTKFFLWCGGFRGLPPKWGGDNVQGRCPGEDVQAELSGVAKGLGGGGRDEMS